VAAARPASSDKVNIQMGIPMVIDCTYKGAKIGKFRGKKILQNQEGKYYYFFCTIHSLEKQV
jgi:hypothetical protein